METAPKSETGQSLNAWAQALKEEGLITQTEFDEFVTSNNAKEEALVEKGFPHLQFYGSFKSIEEIKERLSSQTEKRLIIRCISKDNGEVKRLVDGNLEEICTFAESLPGGFDHWQVEVKEFVTTEISGTIIVEPSGRVMIETWRGAHYLSKTNTPKYQGEFNPDKFHQRYHWQAPEGASDLKEFQEPAIRALRYIFPHLRPRADEPIYVEYGVKPNGEIYFLEASNSPFLTGRLKED